MYSHKAAAAVDVDQPKVPFRVRRGLGRVSVNRRHDLEASHPDGDSL